jgi:putative metallohydrolase (TIGR04338 family)
MGACTGVGGVAMNTRPRDSQRSRLYKAEHVLLMYGENAFGSNTDTQRWVDRVLGERWFRSRWQLPTLPVTPGRGGTATSWGGRITVGPTARNPGIVLHEIAHEIIRVTPRGPYASHGPEFASVLLFLVRQVMGPAQANELRLAFVRERVRHRAGWVVPAPRYDVPTQSTVQAAARREAARPVTRAEALAADDVLRRLVRAGKFGPAGSATRNHALETARTLTRETL